MDNAVFAARASSMAWLFGRLKSAVWTSSRRRRSTILDHRQVRPSEDEATVRNPDAEAAVDRSVVRPAEQDEVGESEVSPPSA
jgi:hypothetical protein